jgi:hypothetical protein
MAGAFVQNWEVGNPVGETTSITVSGATANNLLVAVVGIRGGGDSLTNHVGWTLIEYDTSGSDAAAMFYRIATGTSADNLTVNFVDNGRTSIQVFEFSGLDSTSPFEDSAADSSALSTAATSIGTGSATPTSANGMAVAGLFVRNWDDWSASDSLLSEIQIDSSFTGIEAITRGGVGTARPIAAMAYLAYTSATAKSATWSTSYGSAANSNCWGGIAVFKEAGGGGTSVTANDITQSQTIDNVTLTQANVLAVNSMAHGQAIDPASIDAEASITLQDLTQGQTIDNAALTQANIVSVDSLGQGQTIENATLTQAGAIAVNSIEQSQTIDQITLTQAHVLVAADMTQAQAIDEITLLASGTLSLDAVSQSQTIENATLTQANVLAVNSLSQGQTIDEALLTIAGVISIDGVTQAQVLDALELIQANVLAPNGITQSQSVDNATVSAAGFTLNPDDITQSQAIDGTTLTQYHVLAVDGLTQAQAIDIALFGGLVIGSLNGQVVVYAAMGGNVYVIPDLSGTIH